VGLGFGVFAATEARRRGVPGAAEGIVMCMLGSPVGGVPPDPGLAVEAAWVAAFLTAGSDANLDLLVAAGLPAAATSALGAAAAAGGAGRAALTPLVRCLGNSAAAGATKAGAAVADVGAPLVAALGACLLSDHRGVQRESCWALSNFAGISGGRGADALAADGGAMAALMRMARDAPLDIRKEAAFGARPPAQPTLSPRPFMLKNF